MDESKFTVTTGPRRREKIIKRTPRRPSVEPLDHHRLVTVTLSLRHDINGRTYGPGKTQAPYDVAMGMLHTEGRAQQVEEALHGAKAVIIGPRGRTGQHRTTEVPPEQFDAAAVNALPIETVSGRGVALPVPGPTTF